MKKFIKFGFLIACTALPFVGFTSCSDDNDEPANEPAAENLVNPKNVFTQGVPTKVGDMAITTNSLGKVTKIIEDDKTVIFNYTGSAASKAASASAKIPTDYDMTMNVTWGNDADGVDFYINLNKQGFIEYAFEVDEDEHDGIDTDEWWFTYTKDGRLETMKRTEGNNEITTITYTNGNITKVSMANDDGDRHNTVISYSTETTAPIENKSGMMLFDDTFRIDMDEMAPAYFAGILGKGTVNLPIYAEEDDGYKYDFTWTLNPAGMPIKWLAKITTSDGYSYTDEKDFTW